MPIYTKEELETKLKTCANPDHPDFNPACAAKLLETCPEIFTTDELKKFVFYMKTYGEIELVCAVKKFMEKYTNPDNPLFDRNFTKRIYEINPAWFQMPYV